MFTQRVSLTQQDARQVSTNRLHALGTICETADGRSFRYSSAGAVALAAGLVNTTPAAVANHTNVAVAVAAPVGARSVSVTVGATAVTVGQYDGGYLVVNDAAGVGAVYRINGTPAIASSGTGVVQLEEAVATALTTASKVSFQPNPWGATVVVASSAAYAAGVPNVAVAAGSFYWAQTSGLASVLSDGVIAKGVTGVLSGTTAGAVVTGGTTTITQNVSVAIEATVAAKYYQQFLTLE
jgi:hypothetical protein